jgi:hypothetical protein
MRMGSRSHGIRVTGLGILLTGLAFILAALSDIFLLPVNMLAGDILALVGVALVLIESGALRMEQRRGVMYGVILYAFALLLAFLTGIGAVSQTVYLSVIAAGPSALAAPPPSLLAQMVMAMVVNALIYISFFLFLHRISAGEHRALLWLGLLGGLFIAIIIIPLGEILSFYSIGGVGAVLSILRGTVNIVFGVSYLITGARLL